MPTKRFKYIIDNNGTETELTTDPKGWESHEIAFDRNDDFGLNIQNAVSLSFSGVARNILKSVYESNGIFKNTKTIIKRRKNDWTYAPFYVYRHDYSKYKDNMKYVEIPGIEDGLADKFDTYKDTEYEIDLPISNKVFIDYSGASYTDKNTIQCGFGDLGDDKEGIGDDNYVLKGTHAIRSYTDKIAFTDSNGLPYKTMTFRALKSGNIPIDVFMKLTIKADASLGFSVPNKGNIVLLKHNADFTSPSYVTGASQITPSSTSTKSNDRVDVFTTETTWTITVVSGGIYSFFYRADDTKNYDDIEITEGKDCRVEFNVLTTSSYQNTKLEAFSYEWLIEQLLLKIDPSAEFESTVAYPNVKELISCTPCIQNMGKTSGTGKIKTTLKNVLESFNKLKCIAIDITGNKMTISNRLKVGSVESKVYPTDSMYGVITVNNIVVEHDISHQYNKVKVGANTDDRRDDDPLVYPFICEKQYNIENTLSENELDLVNNFMLDPYAIDRYIIDTLSKEDVKDECKFVVFACTELVNFQLNEDDGTWTDDATKNISMESCIAIASQTFTILSKATIKFGFITDTTDSDPVQYNTTSILQIKKGSDIIYRLLYTDDPVQTNTLFSIELNQGTYIIEVICQTLVNSGFNDTVYNLAQIVGYNNDENMLIEYSNQYLIYHGHDKPITGFSGDSDTIYNIPLTPQRILNRWKEYLAISFVGSSDKTLKFGTTEILNSAIVSKCDYEASNVSENTDFLLTSVTPVFLPSIISVDTPETIIDVNTFEDEDKYKYFEFIHQKSGKIYQGWINSATFAISKNKSKQIMFQAKKI